MEEVGNRIRRTEFGNLVGLKPISITTKDNKTKEITTLTKQHILNHNRKAKTKSMKISEPLYQRLFDHSRKYYDGEPYETIIENLLDCFDKHNSDKRYCGDKLPLPK